MSVCGYSRSNSSAPRRIILWLGFPSHTERHIENASHPPNTPARRLFDALIIPTSCIAAYPVTNGANYWQDKGSTDCVVPLALCGQRGNQTVGALSRLPHYPQLVGSTYIKTACESSHQS